jgi:sulfur carrier protein
MRIRINGEDRAFPDSSTHFTLALLVEALDMKSDRVAVELNRAIVPRDRWSQTPLKDGDHLEIVHFVGGGSPPLCYRRKRLGAGPV